NYIDCVMYVLYYYFFFSSRRRHTRSKRDWSSDVCSSDLISVQIAMKLKRIVRNNIDGIIEPKHIYLYKIPEDVDRLKTLPFIRRSEERRVGKECRSWLWR